MRPLRGRHFFKYTWKLERSRGSGRSQQYDVSQYWFAITLRQALLGGRLDAAVRLAPKSPSSEEGKKLMKTATIYNWRAVASRQIGAIPSSQTGHKSSPLIPNEIARIWIFATDQSWSEEVPSSAGARWAPGIWIHIYTLPRLPSPAPPHCLL